jgi:hypothetical protein
MTADDIFLGYSYEVTGTICKGQGSNPSEHATIVMLCIQFLTYLIHYNFFQFLYVCSIAYVNIYILFIFT